MALQAFAPGTLELLARNQANSPGAVLGQAVSKGIEGFQEQKQKQQEQRQKFFTTTISLAEKNINPSRIVPLARQITGYQGEIGDTTDLFKNLSDEAQQSRTLNLQTKQANLAKTVTGTKKLASEIDITNRSNELVNSLTTGIEAPQDTQLNGNLSVTDRIKNQLNQLKAANDRAIKLSLDPKFKEFSKNTLDENNRRIKTLQEFSKSQKISSRSIERQRQKSKRVMAAIDKALEQSSPLTTGFGGSVVKHIPVLNVFTKNLESTLQTIKANIGFDQLQAMRDSSPTGGALGQVSEKEIDFLQSVLSNLAQSQSQSQLDENLEIAKVQIKESFERITAAYNSDFEDNVSNVINLPSLPNIEDIPNDDGIPISREDNDGTVIVVE